MTLEKVGLSIGVVRKPQRGRRQPSMTTFDKDSFLASFDSMSIGTQHSNWSYEAHVYSPYVMNYDQPLSFNYGMSFKSNRW